MNLITVTIIGGGACGVATFLELYQQLQRTQRLDQVVIHLVEKRKKMAEGLAFGTSQTGHLLNTAANLMGIFVNEPDHYGQWVRDSEQAVLHHAAEAREDAQTFSPRRTYGRYLEEQYTTYVEEARARGLRVEEHQEEATDLLAEGSKMHVALASGTIVSSDIVVLALGTPKPDVFPKLQGKPHYIDFPWPSSRLIDIPDDAPVGVIGSSLSAIDTLMTLADHDHRGPITLYSLKGFLPKVQLVDNDELYERQLFTLGNVHRLMREQGRRPRVTDLFRLFQQEVEQLAGHPIDWPATGRSDQSAHTLLEEDIRAAEEGTDILQRVVYSLRYDSSELWALLDDTERGRFNRWLGTYWKITRHCMPLVNALRVRDFFEQGQLSVVGNTQDFQYDEEQAQFVISTPDATHTVPYLVNATGTATDLDKMDMPLARQLLSRSLVIPHPAGGIRADRRTLRVTVPDHPDLLLYGVGQLLTGELLDTNAVWFNVATVGRLCTDILRQIDERISSESP